MGAAESPLLDPGLLSAALEQLPVGIILLDKEGVILWENAALRQLTGVPDGDVSPDVGAHLGQIGIIDQPHVRQLTDAILAGGRIGGQLLDFRSGYGRSLSVILGGGTIRGVGDATIGHFITLQDAEVPENLAGRLLNAQRMELVGVAVTGVIHDLNNILTGVGGTLELLRGGQRPSRELLHSLDALVRRSRDVARQLVQVTRPESESPEPLDLRTPIRQAIDLLGHSFNAKLRISTGLPDKAIPIFGQRTELLQCLFNLGVNARDAMGGVGELRITLEEIHDPSRCSANQWPGSSCALLRVQDDGPGIPKQLRQRIFEPFFSTKGEDGTGVGLSVVQQAVLDHYGTIELLDSEQGGACFELAFPLHPGEVADDEPTKRFLRPDFLRAGPAPLQGRRILIADDEPSICLMLEKALSARGASVLCVHDGKAAIEAVRAAHGEEDAFDSLIIDLQMPVMGGIEAIEDLRAVAPELRIIATSGMDAADGHEALPADSALFLPKPFGLTEVVEALAAD